MGTLEREDMKFYYYKITNIKNGRFYIGITINPHKRQLTHFNNLQKHIHPNYKMQADYDQYGKDNFVFDVIDTFEGTADAAYQKEYDLIQQYHATESYNILDGGHSNPVYNEQCLAKLKAAHQKKYDNILQYSFDGKAFTQIQQFGSIRDAARETGCDFRAIQNALKTGQSHHGFYWVKQHDKDHWLQVFLSRFQCCVAKINEEDGTIEDTALTIREFAEKYQTTYWRIYGSICQNNRCERRYKFIRISAAQFAEINHLSL